MDLPDVLPDHVEVVEQPLARRADVDAPLGARGEPCVDVLEDPPGLRETGEEGRLPPPAYTGREALLARDGTRLLGELVGPEELAADGPAKSSSRPAVDRSGSGRRKRSGVDAAASSGKSVLSSGAGAAR